MESHIAVGLIAAFFLGVTAAFGVFAYFSDRDTRRAQALATHAAGKIGMQPPVWAPAADVGGCFAQIEAVLDDLRPGGPR